MIQLANLFGTADVKAVNTSLFDDQAEDYLRTGQFGFSSPSQIRQDIANVAPRRIRRVLEAIPAFDESSLASAWSMTMALGTGTHVFPDANHRTWMTVFGMAAHGLGLNVALSVVDAVEMTEGSKRLRDPFRRETGRYWTVEELLDGDHIYRDFYRGFEGRLVVNSFS